MPEITSRDNVLAKLREFDEHMDGAISSAKTLIRFKEEAEKTQDLIHQTRQKNDELRMQLDNISFEWNEMKAAVIKTRDENHKARQQMLKEFGDARMSIDQGLATAEERLQVKNADVLLEHMRLESASREHAKKSALDRDSVMEQAKRLEQLLSSIRENLYAGIKSEFSKSKDLIENGFNEKKQTFFENMGEQSSKLSKGLQEDMAALKQEVKNDLLEHKQGIERHLTEFLNKQNVLVQNLTQQVDGYYRSSQTLLAEQVQLQQQMQTLEKNVEKTSVELHQSSKKQDTEIGKIQSEAKKISVRLEQTIALLKTTISRHTFKDL